MKKIIDWMLSEETTSGDVIQPGDPSIEDQKKKPELLKRKRKREKDFEEDIEEEK